jgi:hypothetical protein
MVQDMSCPRSTASTGPAAACLRASGCRRVAACPAREGAAVAPRPAVQPITRLWQFEGLSVKHGPSVRFAPEADFDQNRPLPQNGPPPGRPRQRLGARPPCPRPVSPKANNAGSRPVGKFPDRTYGDATTTRSAFIMRLSRRLSAASRAAAEDQVRQGLMTPGSHRIVNTG